MNVITISGNLAKEPMVNGDGDSQWGIIRIAQNFKRGEELKTLFIDVKLFGSAFRDFQYWKPEKGSKVVVVGRLTADDYVDKDHNNRVSYAINANSLMKAEDTRQNEPEF